MNGWSYKSTQCNVFVHFFYKNEKLTIKKHKTIENQDGN